MNLWIVAYIYGVGAVLYVFGIGISLGFVAGGTSVYVKNWGRLLLGILFWPVVLILKLGGVVGRWVR